MGSGYPKCEEPPVVFVLKWIPFQTIWLSLPVVTLLPTVNINFLSNAYWYKANIYFPSGLSGKYAVLWVPGKLIDPLFPASILIYITIVPQPGNPSQLIWSL